MFPCTLLALTQVLVPRGISLLLKQMKVAPAQPIVRKIPFVCQPFLVVDSFTASGDLVSHANESVDLLRPEM